MRDGHELKGQTTGVSKGLFRVLIGFEIMSCSFRSEESPCSQVLELVEESTSNNVGLRDRVPHDQQSGKPPIVRCTEIYLLSSSSSSRRLS